MKKRSIRILPIFLVLLILLVLISCGEKEYEIYLNGFNKYNACENFSMQFSLIGKLNSENIIENVPMNIKYSGELGYINLIENPKIDFSIIATADGESVDITGLYKDKVLSIRKRPGGSDRSTDLNMSQVMEKIGWPRIIELDKSDIKNIKYDSKDKHLTIKYDISKVKNGLIDSYISTFFSVMTIPIAKDEVNYSYSEGVAEFFFNEQGEITRQIILFNVNMKFKDLFIPYSVMSDMVMGY